MMGFFYSKRAGMVTGFVAGMMGESEWSREIQECPVQIIFYSGGMLVEADGLLQTRY